MRSFILFFVILFFSLSLSAQSFKKGVILISLTEGSTHSQFITTGTSGSKYDGESNTGLDGNRDPLTIEYGITNRIGLALSMGGDNYGINCPNLLFLKNQNNVAITQSTSDINYLLKDYSKCFTSEITFEINYHFLIKKRIDWAAYVAAGPSSIKISSNEGTSLYLADGGIFRTGFKTRYYFTKHIGVVWMLSAFDCVNSPHNSQIIIGWQNVATEIRGIESEI